MIVNTSTPINNLLMTIDLKDISSNSPPTSTLDRMSIKIKDVNKLAFKIFPKTFNTKLH